MRFTALEDFFSPETKSQYVKGLSYTARTPALAALVEKWLAEGKVAVGGAPAGKLSGKE